MTIQEIKALVNRVIVENYTGDITAEELNQILNETLDTIGSQEIKVTQLASEITGLVLWDDDTIELMRTILLNAVYIRDMSGTVNTFIENLYENRGKIYVADPVLSLVDNIVTVEEATNKAVVYYTTDGSNPTEQSHIYENPVVLIETCTFKAVAVKSGVYSNVVAIDYVKPMPQFITFVDPNVKAICISNYDLDEDGELTYTEAQRVTNI